VDTGISLGHIGPKEYRFHGEQITHVNPDHIKTWKDIEGWFDYEDLYRYIVREIPDHGLFVEVGCWLGRSIGAFASFAKEAGKDIKIHVVDTFQGRPANAHQEAVLNVHGGNVKKAFSANMIALGLGTKIIIHEKDSVEAAKISGLNDLDGVFIDGDHRENFVYADIEAWAQCVKPGGILAGHDIDEAGVKAAVSRFFGTKFETVGRCWMVRT
jgi:cephalosporin hydroxylase